MTVQEKIDPEVEPIKEAIGVVDPDRKLARIVIIDDVIKHPNADRLSLAIIGGWQCVVKLDEYKKGDRAIYCEVDSLLPLDNYELFGFLEERRSDIRTVAGKSYHRLKSVKFRKELAQGLLVPIPAQYANLPPETNLTMQLGILKYETKGSTVVAVKPDATRLDKFIAWILGDLIEEHRPWPAGIRKTDQDRIQNKTVMFNSAKESGEPFEVSYKFDGSSMTAFALKNTDGSLPVRTGLCSRNNEIITEVRQWNFFEQCRYWLGTFLGRNRSFIRRRQVIFPSWKTNSGRSEYANFIDVCNKLDLFGKLKSYQEITGHHLTLQGELVGPGIEKNKEGLEEHDFYVFEVFIDGDQWVCPTMAKDTVETLGLKYIPVFHPGFVIPKDASIKTVLDMADGPRAINPGKKDTTPREGFVFKSLIRPLSFKVISNKRLIKEAAEED